MNVRKAIIGLTVFFTLATFACNTENVQEEPIIGSWQVDLPNQQYKEYYSFDSNGVTYKFRVYENNDAELIGPKGSYAISERSIHLVFEEVGFFYDYIISGDTLLLEGMDEELLLIKVGELDLAYLPIF